MLSLLLYWFAVHLLDISLLQHRFCSLEDAVLRVSVLNEQTGYPESECGN